MGSIDLVRLASGGDAVPKQTQLINQCESCGREVEGSLSCGRCNACYKREVWRPRGGPAVERERDYNHWNPGPGRGSSPDAPRGSKPVRARVCTSCKRSFKARPSAPCPRCGDEGVSYNGDPYEYDRAMGWLV